MDDQHRILSAWLQESLAFGVEHLFRAEATASADREVAEPAVADAKVGRATLDSVQRPLDSREPESALCEGTGDAFEALNEMIARCRACSLCESRTQTVPGEGSPTAQIMFVGEAPGHDEDVTGRPFVGKAGQLLTKMIEAMGLRREDVFIANVLKCRPPNNRDPSPEEAEQCLPFLRKQYSLLAPSVVVALGAHAMRALVPSSTTLSSMRGKVHSLGRSKLVVTYHPSYLLRTPSEKSKAWDDLKLAMVELGLPVPGRGA